MPIRKKRPLPQQTSTWEKRLNSYFVGFCRKVFRWSPAYKAVLKRAFAGKDGGIEWYQCEKCGTMVQRKDKQIDHIIPVVDPIKGWLGDWNEYRERMCFNRPEGLQLLCKVPCHREKTNAENKLRRM